MISPVGITEIVMRWPMQFPLPHVGQCPCPSQCLTECPVFFSRQTGRSWRYVFTQA